MLVHQNVQCNVKLLESYEGHIWTLIVPCFCYSYIFASNDLKWFKVSLKSQARAT